MTPRTDYHITYDQHKRLVVINIEPDGAYWLWGLVNENGDPDMANALYDAWASAAAVQGVRS